jgi:signal transduction histidine kinase
MSSLDSDNQTSSAQMDIETRPKNLDIEMAVDCVSHDLSQLATMALGHLYLARDSISQDLVNARDSLDIVEGSIARMTRMMRSLTVRDLTREPELVELRHVVAQIIARLPSLEDRNRITLSTGGSTIVEGDQDQLERLVMNLLTNALEYSATGTLVEVSVFPQGSTALLNVRNHGTGIPEEYADRIFERGFRVANDYSSASRGLGLFICRQIADAHGGRIWAENMPNEGTKFLVSLPLAEPPEMEGALAAPTTDRQANTQS